MDLALIIFGVATLLAIIFGVYCRISEFRENAKKEQELEQERKRKMEQNRSILQYKVAGVTYKNGRRHRQTILRQIRFGDEPYEVVTIHLQKTSFNDEPAVEVWANKELVGYIPKDSLEDFLKRYDRADGDVSVLTHKIYGGGTAPNGEKKNYGMEISVYFKYKD